MISASLLKNGILAVHRSTSSPYLFRVSGFPGVNQLVLKGFGMVSKSPKGGGAFGKPNQRLNSPDCGAFRTGSLDCRDGPRRSKMASREN